MLIEKHIQISNKLSESNLYKNSYVIQDNHQSAASLIFFESMAPFLGNFVCKKHSHPSILTPYNMFA